MEFRRHGKRQVAISIAPSSRLRGMPYLLTLWNSGSSVPRQVWIFEYSLKCWFEMIQSGKRRADPSKGFMIYSSQRYDAIATSIVLILITFLLIIPVYIIWRLTRNTQATNSISPIIGVMLSFTVIFSFVLLKFTKAKRHEILAAAAAYASQGTIYIQSTDML